MKNLKEIKVNTPHVSSLSPEMINIIKDGIISYIKEEIRFFGEFSKDYNFIDNYFNNSDVQDLFKSFIFDQMVFSHYSIVRNGKEVLVSHNTNIDNITEEEIKEYIDSNATLKKYLKDLLYKFYFEHVDVPCITKHSIQNAMKLKKEFEEDGENFDKWDATSVVHNVIGNEDCPSIYFDDVLYDNDLYSFLQQEFNNSDIMQEIKVTPPQDLTSFPVKITRETYDNIAKILSKQGYTYSRNIPLGSINPWVEREKVNWSTPDVIYLVLDPHPNSQNKIVKISITPRKSDTLPGVELEEIKVNTPYSFGDNPKTLNGVAKVETDFFGKGYALALVDLGSHYTFIPYGDQPFVILIPKQYIEPTDKEYYPISSDGVQQLKDLLRQGKIEKVKAVNNIDEIKILKEYPESKINSIITRWGIDPEKDRTRANVARQIITRFEQIKGELNKKLDILVIPDAIRSKDIKNIDLYSFEDLQNLVNSYPESEEKKKKEAIGNFVKQGIDKNTAQSYVARFNTNRDKLKFGAREGIADLGFTAEQILNLIPKRLQQNELFLDPRNWRWEAFEQMMDAIFPSQKKVEDGEENLAETDADKIYDKDGVEIYKGDDVHKCISYNPVTPSGRKKYGWCVTQVGNTNYDYYRFGDTRPTFYFIFDRSKDSSPEYAPFVDQWHAFVIQVNNDGESYVVTGADNRGDIRVKSWDEISTIVPPDTWAKIKNLKQYFKPIELSAVERGRLYASGKTLNLGEFKALPQDEKILYVQGKASKNQLSKDILEILPKYKIDYEGRSTTLANIAIDSGQSMPYSVLKDYESLAKRYAIFRARHDAYGQKPIPLLFVKYLDEPAKEKYLKTFDDSLTFEYIEKYFGDSVASNYVNNEAKDLKFLPASAVKYIQNPKIKQLYELYSKLIEPWQYGKFTNIGDEELADLTTMPGQDVTPTPIDLNQWKRLSDSEKKAVIDVAEKFSGNPKYADFLYALPIIIKDSNETYVLLPKKGNIDDGYYELWMLIDERGNVIRDNIPNESTLDNRSLYNWGPDEEAGYKRIYNIKDLKIA